MTEINPIDELLKGIQLFEDNKPTDVKIVRKVSYQTLTGAILERVTTEGWIPVDGLSTIDVDMADFNDENLIKNFHIKDNILQKKPQVRLDFSKRLLEPSQGGKFTTLPNNMLFVSIRGDTYDYRN